MTWFFDNQQRFSRVSCFADVGVSGLGIPPAEKVRDALRLGTLLPR